MVKLLSGTKGSFNPNIDYLFYRQTNHLKSLTNVWIRSDGFGGNSIWSLFQDTVFFYVQNSTINSPKYSVDWSDWEVFYINVSSICKVRIPNIEYCEPPTGIFKQSSSAFTPKLLAKINVFNTSNRQLKITYSIPVANFASVNIYDIKGSLLRSLVQQQQTAGEHAIYWDCRNNRGEDLPSGQYFFQIVSGDYISVTKTILIK